MTYHHQNAQAFNERADMWATLAPTRPGHLYIEKPAMERELPEDLSGQEVLCIGVGSSHELTAILRRKPRRVVGVDISEKLLEIAAERYPDVQFFQMDMMSLSLAPDSFDFVYSSLAFDYANDWDALLSGVGRLLRAGGRLLFSTHNPRYWAQAPGTGNSFTNRRGITLSQYRMTLQIVGVDMIF